MALPSERTTELTTLTRAPSTACNNVFDTHPAGWRVVERIEIPLGEHASIVAHAGGSFVLASSTSGTQHSSSQLSLVHALGDRWHQRFFERELIDLEVEVRSKSGDVVARWSQWSTALARSVTGPNPRYEVVLPLDARIAVGRVRSTTPWLVAADEYCRTGLGSAIVSDLAVELDLEHDDDTWNVLGSRPADRGRQELRDRAMALARDGDSTIWISSETRDVRRIRGDGASETLTRADLDAVGLTAVDGVVYWTCYRTGQRWELREGKSSLLTGGLVEPMGLTIAGDALLVATATGIVRVDRGHGGVTTTSLPASAPLWLAASGDRTAWTDAAGRVAVSGPHERAHVIARGGRPTHVALQDGYVVWLDAADGRVRRAPLPNEQTYEAAVRSPLSAESMRPFRREHVSVRPPVDLIRV